MTRIFTDQNKRSVLIGETVVTALCMLGLLACAITVSLATQRKGSQTSGLPDVGVVVLAWFWGLFYVLKFTDAIIHLAGNTAFQDSYPAYYAVMEIFDVVGFISFLWIFTHRITASCHSPRSLQRLITTGGAAILSVILTAFYAVYVVYVTFLIRNRVSFEPDVRKWQIIVEKFSFAWILIYMVVLIGILITLILTNRTSIKVIAFGARSTVCSLVLLWTALLFSLIAYGLQIWPPTSYSYLYVAFPVDSPLAQYLYATDFITIIFIALAVGVLAIAVAKPVQPARSESDTTLQGQTEENNKESSA